MANPTPEPAAGNDPGPHRTRSTSGAPRWVKVCAVVAAVVALALLILMLVGSGDHGPDRHLSLGSPAAVPSAVAGTPLGGQR